MGNFDQAYKHKSWGKGESLSGPGSSIKNCEELIDFIQTLDIKSILDLGCGDLNWIAELENIAELDYYGIDVVDTLIRHHKRVFPWFKGETNDAENVFRINADLIICKDVFIHLCNGKCEQIIQNIRAGEWKYFLCGNYPNANNKGRRGLNSPKFSEYNVFPSMEGEKIYAQFNKPCGGEYLVFHR